MIPDEAPHEKAEPPKNLPPKAEPSPLAKGRPLTREESVERMYRRFGKTFEALAK